MIKEAILALKEKSGSSPYAIAKHMEEKYKASLPANFRKTLTVQLRNSLARGNLVKVKGSFKLSDAGKKASVGKMPAPVKTNSAGKQRETKPTKASLGGKRKASAATKVKDGKPTRVGTKAKKQKKTPAAKPKQPKSIKSPAAKRSRKTSAA